MASPALSKARKRRPRKRIYVVTYDDGTPSGATVVKSEAEGWLRDGSGNHGPFVYELVSPKRSKP